MSNHINRLYCTDALTGLRALPPASVPLTVTSPPWDDARNFGGHEFDWGKVADELWRVTSPGGIVCWEYQDQIRDGSETATSARQRLHFLDLGFRIYQTIYALKWSFRRTPRRFYRQVSQVSVLSKGRPNTINLLRDRRNSTAGNFYQRHNFREVDGRYSASFCGVIGEYGIRGDTWLYHVGGRKSSDGPYPDHPALMPKKLARDLIRAFSNPGDLVLDPCSGAATTAKMSILTGRRFLGFEPHEPYFQIAERRVSEALLSVKAA